MSCQDRLICNNRGLEMLMDGKLGISNIYDTERIVVRLLKKALLYKTDPIFLALSLHLKECYRSRSQVPFERAFTCHRLLLL